MYKAVVLASTRVVSAFLTQQAVGKMVSSYLPDPDSEEIINASTKEKIRATTIYLGGMIATALVVDYVSSAVTDYVEGVFFNEEETT